MSEINLWRCCSYYRHLTFFPFSYLATQRIWNLNSSMVLVFLIFHHFFISSEARRHRPYGGGYQPHQKKIYILITLFYNITFVTAFLPFLCNFFYLLLYLPFPRFLLNKFVDWALFFAFLQQRSRTNFSKLILVWVV